MVKQLTLLLLLVGALPLRAYRREYRVTLRGERKEGSEVCFYRGETARNPFGLFFAYDKARCLPAGEVIDFPPGLFHVFARHRDGFVSEHRDYFAYRGEPNPEKGYAALDIPLREAAYVDVTAVIKEIHSGESVGIWIAQTPATSGTFLPLVDGESTIMVPSETPLLPLVIANHEPIAIGEPLYLTAGERTALAPFRKPASADSSLVVWTTIDRPDEVRGPLNPPEAVLAVGDKVFKPLFPLYDAEVSTTPLFFRHIPAGEAHLQVKGRFWRSATRKISIGGSSTTVERDAIVALPAGAIVVSWSGAAAPRESTPCQAAPDELQPETRAALEECDASGKCSRVAVRGTRHGGDSIVFDGVAAGKYRVVLKPPGAGKPVAAQADVSIGRDTPVVIPIEAFTFYGSVTLNREPLSARILFSTGTAMTDETGRYTAMLPADPDVNLVTVVSCADGRMLRYVPTERISPNGAFDIDLRLAAMRVEVTEDGGQPVSEANVWYAPLKDEQDGSVFYTSPQKSTNAEGSAAFDDIPADKKLSLCAAKEGFGVSCINGVKPEQKTASIHLHRAAQAGRVVNHEGTAYVAAVDPLGRIAEYTTVATDGRFFFRQAHTPPEYVVYTSDRRSLAVLPLTTDPETKLLTLTLPPAPSRSFSVSVPLMKSKEGIVGVWIGNSHVPLQMLAFHEEARGHDVMIHRGERLLLHDILETAPISVAFGEYPADEPFDVFTRPQYAGVARQRVAQAEVTITP